MSIKSRSKEILDSKYLWLICVLSGILIFTSCERKEAVKEISNRNEKPQVKTVVKQVEESGRSVENKKEADGDSDICVRNVDIIPFGIIAQAPVFPGCEEAEDQKKCFKEKIDEFVKANFNKDLSKNLGLTSDKRRIYVLFTIDKTGKIINVKVRSPHPVLEKEALRVVGLLPRMKPGISDGKEVPVNFTLPITLNVE